MLGPWGKGLGWGTRRGSYRPKGMLKPMVRGTTILPKVGAAKPDLGASPKSTRAQEEKMMVVMFIASLLLLETHQCLELSSPWTGITWDKTGENVGCFSCLFCSKAVEWGS